MATVSITTPSTISSSLVTTELNALANGAYSLPSSAVTTGLHLYADFVFTGGGSTTPTAGGYIAIYLIPNVNGTYPTANTSSVGPGEGYLAGIFPLSAQAQTITSVALNVPLPAVDYKIVIGNFSGVAFAATGNTITSKTHDLTVA